MDVQMNILDKHIGVWEGLLDPKLCDAAIDHHDRMASAGMAINRQAVDYAPNAAQDESNFYTTSMWNEQTRLTGHDICTMITDQINRCMTEYVQKFPALSYIRTAILEVKSQKTNVGEGYHAWHCENLEKVQGGRIIAWTVFLNDVEEGGETEFLHQGIRVKPTKGTMCFFPTGFTHTHRGNPPISNEKYILTGWVEVM